MSLLVIETHPIQYHAPVYRCLEKRFKIPVITVYGSDFSIAGYYDKEFSTHFSWDVDLLEGYTSIFLSHTTVGNAQPADKVSAKGLGKILDKYKPESVLISGYNSFFYQQALFQTWKRSIPIIFRGETTDHAIQRSFLKKVVRDCFLRLLYSRCQKLLYIGHRSYQHFIRLGCDPYKLFFSPYCVDIGPFQCTEDDRKNMRLMMRRDLGIKDDQKVILFSGKLSRRKGVDILVSSIKKMTNSARKKIVILFVGDGDLRKYLDEAVSQEPVVQARFVGFKNQTHLSAYYHTADIAVLPSRQLETWGLFVNEALNHGLPCVVSNQVGCAPDLVIAGETGEIFESGSAEELILAIQRGLVLSDKEGVRDRCRQKVAGYTIEKAAEGIARAYTEVNRKNMSRNN